MSQNYGLTAPPSFIPLVELEKGPASQEYLIRPTQYSHSTVVKPIPVANPGALGLFSFASTTFILSLINLQARGVATPNVVVGMAIFAGGLVQLLAGMWEFPRGNVFGATAFSSYGAFWMSFATILIPGSGVIDSYAKGPPEELSNALGIYLITWGLFTFLMMIAALRKNAAFVILFACLTATFVVLAIGDFTLKTSISKAGGALGIITAFVAYYCALSELLGQEGIISLPLGNIPK
jgi:succinate-acetate transporter protein